MLTSWLQLNYAACYTLVYFYGVIAYTLLKQGVDERALQKILNTSVEHRKPHLFLKLYSGIISYEEWAIAIYNSKSHLEEINADDIQECYAILKNISNGL